MNAGRRVAVGEGRDPSTERLDRSLPLEDRIRYRAHRIDRIGSSHSNTARALAKDALLLLAKWEGTHGL